MAGGGVVVVVVVLLRRAAPGGWARRRRRAGASACCGASFGYLRFFPSFVKLHAVSFFSNIYFKVLSCLLSWQPLSLSSLSLLNPAVFLFSK